jgi:hypothetical protein
MASTAVQLKDINLAEEAVSHIVNSTDADTVTNVAKLNKEIEKLKEANSKANDKSQAN